MRSARAAFLTVALVTVAVALPANATTPPPPGPELASTRADAPCGWRAAPPRTYEHVAWIVLENHSYGDLVGPPGSAADQRAPYLNALARACGLATDFRAVTHPSLPNYLAMVSGRTGGVASSCTPAECPQHRRTVFDQVRRTGRSWRVLAESMPGPCRRSDAEPYVVRHNPATYFPELRGCRTSDLPMGTPSSGRLVGMLADGRLPALTVVIPNQCHNTHDCEIPAGDAWLSEVVPQVLDGPDYRAGRTALFVTYDEGAGGTAGQSCRSDYDESCHIVTIAVAPSISPGTRSAVRYDLYSLLKTTERLLGLPPLGHAGDDRTTGSRSAFQL